MAIKIFSKKGFLGIIIVLFPLVLLVLREIDKQEKINKPNINSIDIVLEEKLRAKVKQILLISPLQGHIETNKKLNKIRTECIKETCDFEIFFNEFLDPLAKIAKNNQEFTNAASTLGIIYSGNWRVADLNGDGKNEVIVLQRDRPNSNFILLKVIDFNNPLRIATQKLNEYYFSSANSSDISPLELMNIEGNEMPEIIVFLSNGKGGAHLYVFNYQTGRINLVLLKNDLFYPKYSFDKNSKSFMNIYAQGYDGQRLNKVRQKIF